MFTSSRFACLALVGLLTWSHPATAANFPLEITNIKANGTSGMPASSRIYNAYPGLDYEIRAAVVGGAFPFTFALTNAPVGMTVDDRGVVRWLDPQADASPTLVVRDSEGTERRVSWTVRVTASGFKFVSAGGSSTGNGSISSPWRTLADVYNLGAATDIVYFRSGTYSPTQMPRDGIGGPWERVQFDRQRPSTWLAYPGERPLINFRPAGDAGAAIRVGNNDAPDGPRAPYIDGFETTNTRFIGFQPISAGTFRRLRMHDLTEGGDGTNAAFIMTVTNPTPHTGMVIQDCEFYNVAPNSVTIKVYSQEKILIENTVHYNAQLGLEIKGDVRQFSVRQNSFYNISATALGGNMHGGESVQTVRGEILYNISRAPTAVDINQDGVAADIYLYRNTFVGRVQVRNTDSRDGPFRFYNNVIVNNDAGTPAGSHVYHMSVSDPSRVLISNNLVGYPNQNIVDAGGSLTSAYASYIGSHGHLAPGALIGGLPTAPRNFRIVPN